VPPGASVPIYICVRDRVTHLRLLVEWLERAGHERIILVDNDSTYEPCRYYLDTSPHLVLNLGRNLGARALWEAELVPDEFFVWTDPDVLPTEECPLDLVEMLRWALDRYPVPKACPTWYLDDVPETMPFLAKEREAFGRWPLRDELTGNPTVEASFADTTFALWRPSFPFAYEAVKIGPPYQARHLSWYLDMSDLGVEHRYYLDHAEGGLSGSSWKDWPRTADHEHTWRLNGDVWKGGEKGETCAGCGAKRALPAWATDGR
jgi:hypothetical protein